MINRFFGSKSYFNKVGLTASRKLEVPISLSLELRTIVLSVKQGLLEQPCSDWAEGTGWPWSLRVPARIFTQEEQSSREGS